LIDQICIYIIGTKIDLENNRVISTKDGEKLAQELDVCFIEISAKNNINIDELFITTIREIFKIKKRIFYKEFRPIPKLKTPYELPSTMRSDIVAVLKNQTWCDFVFIVSDKTISVNKLIVLARSSTFFEKKYKRN